MHAPTCAALSLALGVAWAGPVAGQLAPDTASYPHPDGPREVLVYLDSLVVVTEPSVPPQSVVDSLPPGVTLERNPGAGVYVLGLVTPASDRPGLFVVGNRVRALHSQIQFAGPFAHRLGSTQLGVILERAVVLFHSGISEATMRASVASAALVTLEVSANQRHLRLLAPGSSSVDIFTAVGVLAADPAVRAVSPEIIEIPPTPPVTPQTPSISSDVPDQWHHTLIETGPAWTETDGGDPDVTIAVIENKGFDTLNVDIKANLWLNPGDPTTNGDDDDLNALTDDTRGWSWVTASTDFDSQLMSYHGTAVAGLAAGAGLAHDGVPEGNVIGVCPSCTLMLLEAGNTLWGRAQAFLYARDNGASVINASWSADAEWVLEVIIEVVGITGRGGLGLPIVFAAGNSDLDVCSGSDRGYQSLSQVITVGASDASDVGVTGNGYGDCIALVAPGWFDPAASPRGLTTDDNVDVPGLNYGQKWAGCGSGNMEYGLLYLDYTRCFTGTSGSAPQVSGAAALMITAYPGISASEVRSILTSTAVEIPCAPGALIPACYSAGWNEAVGYGRLDVAAAVAAAAELNPEPPRWCFPPLIIILIIIVILVIIVVIVIRCPWTRRPWPFGGREPGAPRRV